MADAFPELVGSVYQAVGEPARWLEFLSALSGVLKASQAVIHSQDVTSSTGTVAFAHRLDPDFQRSFGEHYSRINPFMVGQEDLLVAGTVITGAMVCSDAELIKSEYWNGWMQPQRLFHLLGGVPMREGASVSTITAHRPKTAGPFSDADVGLLRDLLPHVQRALQLHRRLCTLEMREDLQAVAFDQLSQGVIIFGDKREVLLVNHTAQEILRDGDGLRLSREGLHASRPVDTAEIRRLVHDACEKVAGHGLGSGGGLSLPRPSGKRALSVLVAPLPSQQFCVAQRHAGAIVFLHDPERALEVSPQLLCDLHELTPAEARLAGLLIQGTRSPPRPANWAYGPTPSATSSSGSSRRLTPTARPSWFSCSLGSSATCANRVRQTRP